VSIQAGQAKTTVITGATDGIGRELSNHYGSVGDRLVLLGRRPLGELDATRFNVSNYLKIDLSRADIADSVSGGLNTLGIETVDRLILNAGTGYYGRTQHQTADEVRRVVSVNLRANLALIHACWPYLKSARGQVVLIGSVIAYLPCPDYAVYGATKAAIDGLARSLRYELAPDVRVQVIHPGATRTGLHEKIGVDETRVDWQRFPSAEQVAIRIAKRIGRGPWRSVPGLVNWIVWTLGRRVPYLIDRMARR